MSDPIDALLHTIQNKERRNRTLSLSVLATAYLAALILLAVLGYWYDSWLVLASSPIVAAVLWYISRKGIRSLSVSLAEASAIIESAFSTKDRLGSFVELQESSLEVDTARRDFISLQLRSLISGAPNLDGIGTYKLSTSDRTAALTSLVFACAAFALFWFRPIPPIEQAARAIREIVEQSPDLPIPLQEKALELALTTQGSPSDVARISEALQRTRQELSTALRENDSSGRDLAPSESLESSQGSAPEKPQHSQKNKEEAKSPIKKESPTSPQQENRARDEREKQNQEKAQQEKQNSNEPTQKGEKEKQEKQQGSQSASQDPSKSSTSESQKEGSDQQQGSQDKNAQQKQGGSKSEQGSSSQQQTSEQQESQKSGSGQQEESQDQQSGGQQGEGQGQGGGSAQGQNDSQQQGSKGAPSSSGKGQGEGEQKTGESDGSQQQGQTGSSPSQSGDKGADQALNQLDQALQQMEQAVEQLQQQEQGSQGDGGLGNKESPGYSKEQQGQSGDKPSPNENPNQNNKDSQQGSKGQGSGEEPNDRSQKESSKQGDAPKNEPNDQSSSQNKDGKKGDDKGDKGSQGGEDSRSKDKPQEQKEQGPQGTEDGSGERSSQPDRNARTKDIGEMGEGSGGEGLGPNTAFKESEITSQDEKFDTRYTGNESSLEKNKAPAEPKTSIEDVTLAKPKGSKEKDEQPIPLEYRDILQ